MASQIAPNPNPQGKTYQPSDEDYNKTSYVNEGTMQINEKLYNENWLKNDTTGSILNMAH